jgi:hypothetical protein
MVPALVARYCSKLAGVLLVSVKDAKLKSLHTGKFPDVKPQASAPSINGQLEFKDRFRDRQKTRLNHKHRYDGLA